MEKVDNMRKEMGNVSNVSRKMETKKESKENDANQKHCNKNDEYFDGLTSKLYMFKLRISDLEDILIDNSIP